MADKNINIKQMLMMMNNERMIMMLFDQYMIEI